MKVIDQSLIGRTNLEVSQVGGGVASTVGLEGLLEKSTGGSTITETVRHFLNIEGEEKIRTVRYLAKRFITKNKVESTTNLMSKVKSRCGLACGALIFGVVQFINVYCQNCAI